MSQKSSLPQPTQSVSWVLTADNKDILARDHVKLEIRLTASAIENLALLQDQNSGVSAAFVQGGIGNSEQGTGSLSLGQINYQVFCVFYRATDVLNSCAWIWDYVVPSCKAG